MNASLQRDHGPEPYVFDIVGAARENRDFRRTVWTGGRLQATLMSIPAGGEIGLEIHEGTDQFLCIVQGRGAVFMGGERENLSYSQNAGEGYAVFVPAGTWHNVINTGGRPVKLFSVYTPTQHPHGTVHGTKADADAAEEWHAPVPEG